MSDPKRIIIVVLIAIVMLPLGYAIKGAIDSGGEANARLYNTAIQATEQDRFNYAVDSHQGRVITNGTFTANEPVKFEEMNKKFAHVEKGREEYTRHEREVCTEDSEGNESCHTEVYYTWDYAGGDDVTSPTLTLYGRKYPTSLFNIDGYERSVDCSEFMPQVDNGWFGSKKGCNGHYNYIDGDTRYWYRIVDTSFAAGFIADASDGNLKGMSGGQIGLHNKSVEQMIEDANNYHLGGNIFIWFWWLLVLGIMGGAAYAWVMQDNEFSIYD